MKITAICGSPRDGSTLAMIENILNLIKAYDEDIEIELISVARKNIRHCEGCCDCEEDGKCGIRDEMEDINKIIAESDALIFGSPTYFDNVTGIMKDFIDRTNPLLKDSVLKGKAVAVVAVGSYNVLSVNKAVENLRSFCAAHNMHEVGYLGALNSSLGNAVVLNEMVKIAEGLVNAVKEK